ncbi:MAG: Txe/YoeB family addiction module toxin [Defluviitaleaceae bacterium]|nr:Txe/YoeB family addiction module toxin [Defluviitaleaceae bacterium]
MVKIWSDEMWVDYVYWQGMDKKTITRINMLMKDIERNGVNNGIGKPEFLKHIKLWSRRIDDTNRLIYNICDGKLELYACRGHYEDK